MNKKDFPLALAEIASAWRNELDRRLKPLGLSQAKWRVLLYLSVIKSPSNQIELARRLGVEGSTMVGLLDRLSQAGWIIRENIAEDRRSKAINLTKKAKKVLTQIHKVADELCEELLTDVPAEQLKACEKLFQHIKNNIAKIS